MLAKLIAQIERLPLNSKLIVAGVFICLASISNSLAHIIDIREGYELVGVVIGLLCMLAGIDLKKALLKAQGKRSVQTETTDSDSTGTGTG